MPITKSAIKTPKKDKRRAEVNKIVRIKYKSAVK